MSDTVYRLYRVRRTIHQMLRDRHYMIDQSDIDMSEEDFARSYTGEREGLTIQAQRRDDPTDQIFVFWPTDPKVGVKPIKRCAGGGTGGAAAAVAAPPRLCRFFDGGAPHPDRYMDRMNEDDVKRAILVVQQSLTAFAKQAIVEICAQEGTILEQFQEAELLVNITEHVLVPMHVVLSREEKQTLLKRYRLKEIQLPRMQAHASRLPASVLASAPASRLAPPASRLRHTSPRPARPAVALASRPALPPQVSDPVARYYGLQRGQVVKIVRPSETAGKYVTYRLVF